MITFKQFFLKENTDNIEPQLSDKPQVYITYVKYYYDEDEGRWYTNTCPVYLNNDFIVLEKDYFIYNGDSFIDAVKALNDHKAAVKALNFLKQVSRLENLIGEFRVSYIDSDGDSPSQYNFECKVHLDRYKGMSHAQDDLLGF